MHQKPDHAYPGVVILLDWLQGLPGYKALETAHDLQRFQGVVDGLRRTAAMPAAARETLEVMRAGLWIASDIARADPLLTDFVLILDEAISQLEDTP